MCQIREISTLTSAAEQAQTWGSCYGAVLRGVPYGFFVQHTRNTNRAHLPDSPSTGKCASRSRPRPWFKRFVSSSSRRRNGAKPQSSSSDSDSSEDSTMEEIKFVIDDESSHPGFWRRRRGRTGQRQRCGREVVQGTMPSHFRWFWHLLESSAEWLRP